MVAQGRRSRSGVSSGPATPDGHFVPGRSGDIEQDVIDDGNDPGRNIDDSEDELPVALAGTCVVSAAGSTHAYANDPPLDELELWWQNRIPGHFACTLTVPELLTRNQWQKEGPRAGCFRWTDPVQWPDSDLEISGSRAATTLRGTIGIKVSDSTARSPVHIQCALVS